MGSSKSKQPLDPIAVLIAKATPNKKDKLATDAELNAIHAAFPGDRPNGCLLWQACLKDSAKIHDKLGSVPYSALHTLIIIHTIWVPRVLELTQSNFDLTHVYTGKSKNASLFSIYGTYWKYLKAMLRVQSQFGVGYSDVEAPIIFDASVTPKRVHAWIHLLKKLTQALLCLIRLQEREGWKKMPAVFAKIGALLARDFYDLSSLLQSWFSIFPKCRYHSTDAVYNDLRDRITSELAEVRNQSQLFVECCRRARIPTHAKVPPWTVPSDEELKWLMINPFLEYVPRRTWDDEFFCPTRVGFELNGATAEVGGGGAAPDDDSSSSVLDLIKHIASPASVSSDCLTFETEIPLMKLANAKKGSNPGKESSSYLTSSSDSEPLSARRRAEVMKQAVAELEAMEAQRKRASLTRDGSKISTESGSSSDHEDTLVLESAPIQRLEIIQILGSDVKRNSRSSLNLAPQSRGPPTKSISAHSSSSDSDNSSSSSSRSPPKTVPLDIRKIETTARGSTKLPPPRTKPTTSSSDSSASESRDTSDSHNPKEAHRPIAPRRIMSSSSTSSSNDDSSSD